MPGFASRPLPAAPDALAPDGSQVRILLRTAGGSMAHFQLDAGCVSRAVMHRRVDELWYVLAGTGRIWRSQDGRAEFTDLVAGLCLSIPAGTAFQFRADPHAALEVVATTMPPWPGDAEALAADGPWAAR